jgi:hypothetical protein
MLSASAKRVIDEVLAQLERYEDALQGVEATVIEKDLAYRRGEIVVKETREEPWSPAEEERDSVGNPYEVLTSSRHTLKELPGNEQNEVRIRATPAITEKFDFANFPSEDNLAFILTMSRAPVRLLRMEAELVNVPWWLKWLLKSVECRIEFDYIRGIPVPKTSFMWITSRGIGPWRLQIGNETEVRYSG